MGRYPLEFCVCVGGGGRFGARIFFLLTQNAENFLWLAGYFVYTHSLCKNFPPQNSNGSSLKNDFITGFFLSRRDVLMTV